METRFFAPGSLVSNLDFVEGIFGNGGDPHLPENDAALDVAHWTGHTGCVILAPHLVGMKKSALGLPHVNDATDRQRRDGMCWTSPDELYNEGAAFKICARDRRGVMVTILADNYYGYCKKEVKTQISYAANLFGLAEEEHAGGAIAFATYVLGTEFFAGRTVSLKKATFEQAMALLGDLVERQPEGYAIDRRFPDVFYIPEDSVFTAARRARPLAARRPHAAIDAARRSHLRPALWLPRAPGKAALGGTAWRLVGSRPRGTLCHKPCTVSGGGKSEISKSIAHALLKGPVYRPRLPATTWTKVAEIFERDFSAIYKSRPPDARSRRPILSPDRTLGSVIQLVTAVARIHRRAQRMAAPSPADHRASCCSPSSATTAPSGATIGASTSPSTASTAFSDTSSNSTTRSWSAIICAWATTATAPGAFTSCAPISAPRIKFRWRTTSPPPSFSRARASTTSTASIKSHSVKLVANCETLLFQRPDEAIHRGVDKQAEADISSPGTLLSNYEPLTGAQARALVGSRGRIRPATPIP